jgi:hypothetical protein
MTSSINNCPTFFYKTPPEHKYVEFLQLVRLLYLFALFQNLFLNIQLFFDLSWLGKKWNWGL